MLKKLLAMFLVIILISTTTITALASSNRQYITEAVNYPMLETAVIDDEAVSLSEIFFVVFIYFPFGVEIAPVEGDTNPWRFASMYWDAHTQTYYTPFRRMSPRIGRWTQPDPFWGLHNMQESTHAILQAGNLFVYVMHNPVMFVDPWGLNAIVANNSGYGGVTGHMSAFVRDEHEHWWYFYWGPDGVFFRQVDDASVMSNVRDMNRWINEQGMNNIPLSGRYNSFVFIPGDFTASWNHFSGLHRAFEQHMADGGGRADVSWLRAFSMGQVLLGVETHNNLYNVWRNNCVHVTMYGLNMGILSNGRTVGGFMSSAGFGSVNFDPVVQMSRLQGVFGNTSHTHSGAVRQIDRTISQLNFMAGIPLAGALFRSDLQRHQIIRSLFN